jgi:outer membrane protein assembly factor BamB
MRFVPKRVQFVPIAALAVILGMAAGPAGAAGTAVRDAGTATSTSTNDDWPMFGHDPLHSELSPDARLSAGSAPTLAQEWSVNVSGTSGNLPISASPVVVYNSALGEPVVYAVHGTLDAIDGTPGRPPTMIWSEPIAGRSLTTPAVYNGTVYVGSTAGFVEALDATTGAVECTFHLPVVAPETVPGHVLSSPVVGQVNASGPMVFFGDVGESEQVNAGHEWAITGVGNTAGGCQEVWSFNGFTHKGPTGTRGGSWSEPGLVQDSQGKWLLVFGSSDPDDAIYALNARTGTKVWRFQTTITHADQDVGAGPTISPPGTNGLADGVVYEEGKDHILYALDLLTGQQSWSFNFTAANGVATNAVSVAALKGNVVYEAEGGYLYAFSAVTGALKWHTSPQIGVILGSPTVSGPDGGHVVFIGDLNGDFVAFSAQNGAVLWSTTLTTGPDMADSAISYGVVYTNSGPDLYAFTPSSPTASGSTGTS